ncbi:ankyrin repeat-containing domain, PGG domain protein, partial [Tanacetum coccineum]
MRSIPEDAKSKDEPKEEETRDEKMEEMQGKDFGKIELYKFLLEGNGLALLLLQVDGHKPWDKITNNGNTILHVAVGSSTKNHELLKTLLGMTPKKYTLLDLINSDGSNLLHVAAIGGNIEAANMLVERNPELLFATDKEGHTPLALSISNMHIKTSECLFQHMKVHGDGSLFSGQSGEDLVILAISCQDFSIAKKIINDYPSAILSNSDAVLTALAQNFPRELNFWEGGLRRDFLDELRFMSIMRHNREAEYALSKLLQMGTVAEYHNEFEIFINRVTGISQSLLTSFYISGLKLELQRELWRSRPTTLGEPFSLAHIAEARCEEDRATIPIAKLNDLTAKVQVQDLEQTTQGRGDKPNRILLVTIHHMLYLITVEVLHQVFCHHGYVEKGHNIYEGCYQLDIQFSNHKELQPNQDENIHYYYWENCFSILNTDEADNTKTPLFADTLGNNGGDHLGTSGLVTPAEEVVDNGHSSTLSSLVEHESPRVLQLWEIIRIGDVHELMDNKGIFN